MLVKPSFRYPVVKVQNAGHARKPNILSRWDFFVKKDRPFSHAEIQPPEAGKPGWVYGAGTHLTPNRIWWPYAKPFIDYLARTSFMLQQGLFVADVCYYYGDQGDIYLYTAGG